jgi:hypothetical protein
MIKCSILHYNAVPLTRVFEIKQPQSDPDNDDNILVGPKDSQTTIDADIYPNPITDFFTIEINSDTKQHTTLLLYDILGNAVFQQELKINEGITTQNINLPDFETGTYIIVIQGDTELFRDQIIIQK